MRPHTVRRPRLALGDGAATRVSFFARSQLAIPVELSGGSTSFDGVASFDRDLLISIF